MLVVITLCHKQALQSPREGLCPMWRKICELHLPSWAGGIAPSMQYRNTLNHLRENSSQHLFSASAFGLFFLLCNALGRRGPAAVAQDICGLQEAVLPHVVDSRQDFFCLFVSFTLFCPAFSFFSREGDGSAVKACCYPRAVESQGICLVSFWLVCSSGKRMMQYFCLNQKGACPKQGIFCLVFIQLEVTLSNLSLSMKKKKSGWLEDFVLSCQSVHGLNSHSLLVLCAILHSTVFSSKPPLLQK